jgi:hypothetical protein
MNPETISVSPAASRRPPACSRGNRDRFRIHRE